MEETSNLWPTSGYSIHVATAYAQPWLKVQTYLEVVPLQLHALNPEWPCGLKFCLLLCCQDVVGFCDFAPVEAKTVQLALQAPLLFGC